MSREPEIPVTQVDVAHAHPEDLHFDLPSGRQVALRIDTDREEVVLVGKDGAVELQVVLTDEGPVLRMPVARVSLRGAEQLDLGAKRVRLRAEDDISIEAGGRLDLRSEGETNLTANEDVRVVGEIIHLN